jgi:rhamnulokinase
MEKTQSFLAIDLGAESGRAILGHIDKRLIIEEVHRFPNGPVGVGSHIHLDYHIYNGSKFGGKS